MSKENLKKELHYLIDNTDHENLLNMVKEDLITYGTASKNMMISPIYHPKIL